ncbi:UDP-N-acetylmuramoyl-tripeptide--D-alanyl-D-alanine ligase [Petroclostridium sp. X23]|uniref:UDP-N-acetylmuramoyl-tripeptide--D-alanyl-D- alanine ligase n=1 Tax=Petroclostridium sp. X23 TaxID=3045146 RepID=UPI0024ADC7E9|nr:UDP-N-acetylmuramoyl-tripeptide--D-alanyl-D-alanine ligase [Petroclostridium sp. X23]WHH58889.1 UDP-N-acetylmuramoyl-tripeptide--D-alanyl-D-alanine ligase [Petroclostridium sp. X23]
MEPLKVKEIIHATGGELVCGDVNTNITDISTDSRAIKQGMFFVPLRGESFDGHNFIFKAFENGAVGCVTDRDIEIMDADKCIIKVDDTLTALQGIARFYREKFRIPFVAVTGSVGKTSTKDMIACVLEQKFRVLKTKGNFNNEIGLPLTVLGLDSHHHMGITEMGMSGFNEISRLASIVKPECAVITNIGLSHIEKLGSQENILKAKMEVFENFNKSNVAILNGDDPMLFALKDTLPFRTVYFGIENEQSDLRAYDISSSELQGSKFNINIKDNAYIVNIRVIGEHNIYNALAAIAVGLEYHMEIDDILDGISRFKSGKMRQDIFESKGIKVINDCYNASPTSMEAALKVLKQIENTGNKVAILGDMLEMGEWAYDAHKKVGSDVVKNNIDYLLTMGYNGKYIALGALQSGMPQEKIHSFETHDEVKEFISGFLKSGDAVLVKASRGMKLEIVSEYIREVR